MNDWLEILLVFALSAVKFVLAGVPAAVVAKFSFFKAVTVTSLGGFTGSVVFTYLSDFLIKSYKKLKKKTNQKKPKKKFTFTNRLSVKVKQKFGLAGIAAITPFLSYPFGAFIAVRYFENKQKIVSYLTISTVIWSVLLYFFYHNLYHNISSLF